MRRALTYAGVVAVLLTAAPIAAQTVVSTHPPLSPVEAVRVLRASQSPCDVTDLPFYGLDRRAGPLVLVGSRGGASAAAGPWDWPPEAYEPIRPLAEPWYQTTYVGGWRAHMTAPWLSRGFMSASPGDLSGGSVSAPRDRVPPSPTRGDGTADAATPSRQKTVPEARPGAGVIIRR